MVDIMRYCKVCSLNRPTTWSGRGEKILVTIAKYLNKATFCIDLRFHCVQVAFRGLDMGRWLVACQGLLEQQRQLRRRRQGEGGEEPAVAVAAAAVAKGNHYFQLLAAN